MSAFTGMDDLIADMAKLPETAHAEAAKHIYGAAIGTVAEVRQQYARGQTGNLIKGVGMRQKSPLAITVYSRAPHAHLYEFGTKTRQTKAGAGRGVMPAKPVFVPSKHRHYTRMLLGFQEMLRRLRVRGMTGQAAA